MRKLGDALNIRDSYFGSHALAFLMAAFPPAWFESFYGFPKNKYNGLAIGSLRPVVGWFEHVVKGHDFTAH
jgi:hypothetical protein